MNPELAWFLPLVVALLAGLALVVCFPGRCRTTAAAYRALVVAGTLALNLVLLVWIVATWRRATRNLGLAYTNKHAIKRVRTWDAKGAMIEKEHPKTTYPHLVARPDLHGVVVTVWTRVGVGREEFESAARHLRNLWRCQRVQVSQHKPGRITVRALRRDPLASRLTLPLHAAPDLDEKRAPADDTDVDADAA